jgi:selenide,water dikinase
MLDQKSLLTPQSPVEPIRLTTLASCAGCAAKLDPQILGQVVHSLGDVFQPQDYPDLLVGLAQPDDAAVYRLNDSQAIISTADFFPPVVDNPYEFGAIAAANALSDVYAMGGEPLFALNLAAWPDNVPIEVFSEVLRGGAEKVREAGAVIVGGHTVVDSEPKYGLAVTGLVHPDQIFTKGGALPGDVLILTKPLGAGTLTTGIKRGVTTESDARTCINNMMKLNRDAAAAARLLGSVVHAVTDITGFGLAGHGHEMAHLSGCGLQINFDALPWLPGVEKSAQDWVFPGGCERNERFYGGWVIVECNLASWQQRLLFDPQTSGGLLMAIESQGADEFLHKSQGWVIGKVIENASGYLVIQ